MQEFETIDSAVSAEQLRRRIKADELEQYGDQFTPEYVYDVIRRLPRFASMRVSQFRQCAISQTNKSAWPPTRC
jgi:hypothetical protein